MIGGFILTGSDPREIVIRGIGPLLSLYLTDFLADPTIELRDATGALLVANDNWLDADYWSRRLIELGLAPTNDLESGIPIVLAPGAYTAVLAGKNQSSGVGLIEIYDVEPATNSKLANLSTRGRVQTGKNVMIGGFILGGSGTDADVIVRGIGPSLSQSGLTDLLGDPTLELRDSNGAILAANDNWHDDILSEEQLLAHGLAPQNNLESGIFRTLSPGAFTVILAGKNGGIGIGLVEIYDVSTQANGPLQQGAAFSELPILIKGDSYRLDLQ